MTSVLKHVRYRLKTFVIYWLYYKLNIYDCSDKYVDTIFRYSRSYKNLTVNRQNAIFLVVNNRQS